MAYNGKVKLKMNNSTNLMMRLNGDLKRKYFLSAEAVAVGGGAGRVDGGRGKNLEPLKRRRRRRLVVVVVELDEELVLVDVLLLLFAEKYPLSSLNRKAKKSGAEVIFISFRRRRT